MLPDNRASSLALGGLFMVPDTFVTTPIVDFERGGVALNDPSEGLQSYNWRAWLDDTIHQVYVQRYPDGPAIPIFAAPQITELSLAFDQNMRPAIGYIQAGVLRLNWYDSSVNARVTSVFEEAVNPKMCLDDKRITQRSQSDMILAYLRGRSLFYRQQRDRFQVEYLLRSNIEPNLKLKNVGMNKNLRLQFEMVLK